MRGWNRTSLKDAVKTKGIWVRYCLCLAQILVAVAYFLPWCRDRSGINEGPIIWACSEVATPIPGHILPSFVVVVLGFAAILSSLAFVAGASLLKSNSAKILNAASLLNGLAVACMLFYPPGWVSPYWPDVWSAVVYASTGWYYIALLLGFVAGILILLVYNEMDRPSGSLCPIKETPLRSRRLSPAFYGVTFLLAAGVILVIDGFVRVWGSGTVYILCSFQSWSSSGVESSPAMILVPIAAISVITVFVLSQVLTDGRMGRFRLAANSVFVTAFALSLLWGFATYEQQWSTMDPYRSYASVVQLHSGWYQCIAGESTILLGMSLHHILSKRETMKHDSTRKPGDSGFIPHP